MNSDEALTEPAATNVALHLEDAGSSSVKRRKIRHIKDEDRSSLRNVKWIRQPALECCFWFLRCSYIYYDLDEWVTHCLSHFRGEEPPKTVSCPLCDCFQYTCDNGWKSWNQRMEHIGFHHSLLGETLRASRPDFPLFQHLWQKRLISDQDLKELNGGKHSLPQGLCVFLSIFRRKKRRHRHQHFGAKLQIHNTYLPQPAPPGIE
jgi:hypothetical protein